MTSLFRKALGLFVVLDEPESGAQSASSAPVAPQSASTSSETSTAAPMTREDVSKFEKHFSELFDKANLPGPDYFEFWKTMDTLEGHIPDEAARMHAVFASLKIQGLTKKTLIDTAGQYRDVILKDKASFEAAVASKSAQEIAGRKESIEKMEREREEKRQLIEKLQREIEESAGKIVTLQSEIAAEQSKIENAQRGYSTACTAMVSKIEADIERFHQIVE